MTKIPRVLGFRDIGVFNLVMLARQAWRILQAPDTLSANNLKASYYPNTVFFLKAQLGGHLSQIWREIVKGKEVLPHGLSRRIDEGTMQISGGKIGSHGITLCGPLHG